MTKLVITCGLPASGKTTWAKELVLKSGVNWKILCKDDLRAMLDAGKYSGKNEKMVKKIQRQIAHNLLVEGYNVIIADTNLSPKVQESWKQLAKLCGVQFERKRFLDVPVKECIRRDLNRLDSVGKDVIMDMYNQHIKPTEAKPRQYEGDNSLQKAIIVDIDGTLAQMNGRSPYDWHRVGEDRVDVAVANILLNYRGEVILLSGRDGVCRPETEAWLNKYKIEYDVLHMRKEGCGRKDTVIKKEIFFDQIAPYYNIEFVLDDRDSVVEMWRSIGLKCLQCQPGNF